MKVFIFITLCLLISTISCHPSMSQFYFSQKSGIERIKQHLNQLEKIGERFGNREARTLGFNESIKYVENVLSHQLHYYNPPKVQYFTYDDSVELVPSEFKWVGVRDLKLGEDFLGVRRHGSGSVIGRVLKKIPNGGCSNDDFKDFTNGDIAFFNGRICLTSALDRAVAFRASGVVFYRPDYFGDLRLGKEFPIPIYIISHRLADEFLNETRLIRLVMVTRIRQLKVLSQNLIVESKGGRDDTVIMVGAHLDSVASAHGINDNGSGSATILELAERFATQNIRIRNKLRFIWFGAEEVGLLGAFHYVNTAPEEELKKIPVMINLDMVGSRNYIRNLHNGASSPENIREQSILIQRVIEGHYTRLNQSWDLINTARSDHYAFIEKGVPSTFLNSGFEVKTEDQARRYGGEANKPHDDCYHKPCDDINNVNYKIINELSNAASYCAIVFSQDANLANRKLNSIKKGDVGLSEEEYYNHQFKSYKK